MEDKRKLSGIVRIALFTTAIVIFTIACGDDDDDDKSYDGGTIAGSGGSSGSFGSSGSGGSISFDGGGGESGTPSTMDSGTEDGSTAEGGQGGTGGFIRRDAQTETPVEEGDECSPNTIVDVTGECIAEDDECEGGTSSVDRRANCGEGLICCIHTDQCEAIHTEDRPTSCQAPDSCDEGARELPFGCPGDDVCCRAAASEDDDAGV